MKQAWVTADGQVFFEATDAQRHEAEVLQQVEMWDRKGVRTDDSLNGMIVHLTTPKAAEIFFNIINSNPEEITDPDSCGIAEEDVGWFYWDDTDECYHYMDDDILNLLIAAKMENGSAAD